MSSDLDSAIRAELARPNVDPVAAVFCGIEPGPTPARLRAAVLAVLELKRHVSEDWTHVSETAYELGLRTGLEQAVSAIAEALGIDATRSGDGRA